MSVYVDYLNSVADTITYYPLLVALPIGIIGNVFSFYIYTRPNLNKKTNTGFLYASFCIANLIFMLYFVLVFQSNSLFNYTVTLPCGVMTYLLRIAFCFAPWMQVIISFDRFISVVYPLKKKHISKKWILCIIMLSTFGVLAVANMPNLLSYPQQGRNNFCIMSNEATAAANIILIFLRAYIPFTLMLIFDVIVFKKLRNSRRRVGMIQMGQQRQPERISKISNKEYKFILSTIFIDLTFILFYTPISAHVTITVVNLYISWDMFTGAVINVFYNCALLTIYLYSVFLFVIFLVFNSYFRNEAFSILRLNKLKALVLERID